MRTLLIDSDLPGLEVLSYNLLKRGHMISTARDGREGLGLAIGTLPDLVVLDYSLPTLSGPEVCRRIRDRSDVPIVFLTAFADDTDRATGIASGADDYILKPYSLLEILASLESLGKRQAPVIRRDIHVGSITIAKETREVRARGRKIDLSPRQLRLLYFLAARPGKVFSNQDIYREVWRKSPLRSSDLGRVDVQIRKLREQIEREASNPKLLLSVKKSSYKISKDAAK